MKSKSVAYLLWFFFGLIGVHKFYLGKVGMGILYLFTFGLFGIGWFIDLFTLGTQVDVYNALQMGYGKGGPGMNANNNINNVVVNVPSNSSGNDQNAVDQLHKLAGLKEKGLITEDEFNKQKAKILGV